MGQRMPIGLQLTGLVGSVIALMIVLLAVVRSGQEPRPIRAPGHTPQRVEVAGIQ